MVGQTLQGIGTIVQAGQGPQGQPTVTTAGGQTYVASGNAGGGIDLWPYDDSRATGAYALTAAAVVLVGLLIWRRR